MDYDYHSHTCFMDTLKKKHIFEYLGLSVLSLILFFNLNKSSGEIKTKVE